MVRMHFRCGSAPSTCGILRNWMGAGQRKCFFIAAGESSYFGSALAGKASWPAT
jgi:hypothetical protein